MVGKQSKNMHLYCEWLSFTGCAQINHVSFYISKVCKKTSQTWTFYSLIQCVNNNELTCTVLKCSEVSPQKRPETSSLTSKGSNLL